MRSDFITQDPEFPEMGREGLKFILEVLFWRDLVYHGRLRILDYRFHLQAV